ncbi:ectoine/hydroxyectoine ABC transporter permease subunit EhuD [Allonocardiopsis opalescens]|uniref:Polar amino acid transport system permease protein n=1 Tax=Allonocardiopsis opalescens TaxID=1144618 RepID=A0A2T0Q9M7_9ACTN|nr:ectoine/hydroxyectoine ABC transporter permease subunit EhuD [Allonocardiopsis opalescens]PRY00545.1 polar amino acid transport system permease protein [Allonocardiopsis opalescens]
MSWDWDYALSALPILLQGLQLTVIATIGGYVLAIVLGLVVALVRRLAPRWAGTGVYWVMEFIRSTPLLVQLFVLYFGLPVFGIVLPPMVVGIIGLGLHYAAYTAEVYRSGIEAVPRGQWEAATALNLPTRRVWTGVVLPQAIPKVIPALGNYLISMFKDTPLLLAIGVVELLNSAYRHSARTFEDPFELMTMVGLLFLAVSIPSAIFIRHLERRYAAV